MRRLAAVFGIVVLLPFFAGAQTRPILTGTFELDNQQTGYIKTGTSRITAISAWATRSTVKVPANAPAIEIQFFTQPLTKADTVDIVEHGARQLRKHDFAALVLILDANNRIAQVNLSYVVPGATVARTVAWAPRELAEWNNAFHLDGSRVQLKLKSTFTDVNDKHERLKLSWNVDVDLAVAPAK